MTKNKLTKKITKVLRDFQNEKINADELADQLVNADLNQLIEIIVKEKVDIDSFLDNDEYNNTIEQLYIQLENVANELETNNLLNDITSRIEVMLDQWELPELKNNKNYFMNSKEFIKYVSECQAENWLNSDINREIELNFEKIAEHFQDCEECSILFDEQNYPQKTLIELAKRYDFSKLEDWICDKKDYETIRTKLIRDDIDEFDFTIEEDKIYQYDVIIEIDYIQKDITYLIIEKTQTLQDVKHLDASQYNFDDFEKSIEYLKSLAKERQEEKEQLAYEFYQYLIDFDFIDSALKIIKKDAQLLGSAEAFYNERYEYSPDDENVFEYLQFYLFAEIEQNDKEKIAELIDELAKEKVPIIESWQQAQAYVAREILKLSFQAIADVYQKDVSTIQRNFLRAKKKI